MEVENTLSQKIRSSDGKSEYDAACKQLLAEKIVLAWILHDCVAEFKNTDVNDIAEKYIEGSPEVSTVPVHPDEVLPVIQGMATEDKTVHEGTVTFDIKFFAITPDTGEPIRLIINVEAQNKYNPGYPIVKRAIYYDARLISSQYGKEFVKSQYGKIKKVYSIWVCMNPPEKRGNTISGYSIREENIIGEFTESVANYDLMSAVIICRGKRDGKNYFGVIKLLDVLLSNDIGQKEKRRILQEDFNIKMSETLERKVDDMCNLSEGVWQNGVEHGMEKGIKEGLEKGMREGAVLSTKSNIVNLMDSLKITVNVAMDMLRVPMSDREMYIGMLKEDGIPVA